jgi:hypothetical protein
MEGIHSTLAGVSEDLGGEKGKQLIENATRLANLLKTDPALVRVIRNEFDTLTCRQLVIRPSDVRPHSMAAVAAGSGLYLFGSKGNLACSLSSDRSNQGALILYEDGAAEMAWVGSEQTDYADLRERLLRSMQGVFGK